ncbi:MAG: hypothetical protein ACXU8U_08915 [Asticcacaulis sp.]
MRFNIWRAFMAAMAVACAAPSAPVHAATMTPDLHRLMATPQALRGGDFDGDGRADSLYLVNEPDTGRIAVHIRLDRASGAQDFRVTSLDTAANETPDLRIVSAGAYAADCGTSARDCGASPVRAAHDAVMLGADGGATVLLYWSNGRFEQDFVKADAIAGENGILAHAVAALYAVNP